MYSNINHEIEVESLRELVDSLQKENRQLKDLLKQAGIDYSFCMDGTVETLSVQDQGKRILPFAITEDAARHFFARFWGREDVYAKRSVNKKTGKAGYFPQCDNFWHYGVCPKTNRVKVQCSKCENQRYSKLGIAQIMEHLKGEKEDASDGENEETRIKPWEYQQKFHQEDITGSMKIVLSNLVYVDTKNLKYRLQNRVRRLAALLNPVYFKNQRIGYSNYQESRTIYMGQDEHGYIGMPRGIYDELIQRCDEAGIKYQIEDKRTVGRTIDVTFQGELRESQVSAVEKMLEQDTGILSAATAFGKTVVCSKLIAERKVSTIILLESSALIEQWMGALQDFLDIREELPEYRTPSGRIRRRKSVIGRIHGAHDSSTGIVDIAMVGSLCKKGKLHPRLQEYGMCIMDECHHAATATVIEILKEVKAKYVYGVTATPMRSDGLEKIGYMLLGDIRYRYTAKDRAKEQGIEHLVYPRFTRVAYPRSQEMHINDAYMLLKDNEVRNEQIVADVKKCVDNGRTPVILTRYKEHAALLSERLQAYADKFFLLSGDKSKKELQEIRRQMEEVSLDETMILVATGQMVGEGFDYPRLDTLIMATPVSWKGIVEQYAGRLNRDYDGKKNVVIYDYVDSHIDKFDRMYGKRLKAYKQIGYQICTNISAEKQEAGAIYDFENYLEVFERDLQEAEKDIIISSPQMNRKKVYWIISLLKERQEAGVKVTIVTWHPDCYKYGKSEVRMELLEQLRSTGFEIQLMEDACEHFAVVDQKIVWYGSMNFLSKEDMEDNLMRVVSRDIAAEIMEMTFGGEKELMDW